MLVLVLGMLLSVVSADIEGPAEFEVGQLAVVDGSRSEGERIQWKIPPEMRFLPSKNLKMALTCDIPGKYTIILVAVDKDLEIAVATHEIEVKAKDP